MSHSNRGVSRETRARECLRCVDCDYLPLHQRGTPPTTAPRRVSPACFRVAVSRRNTTARVVRIARSRASSLRPPRPTCSEPFRLRPTPTDPAAAHALRTAPHRAHSETRCEARVRGGPPHTAGRCMQGVALLNRRRRRYDLMPPRHADKRVRDGVSRETSTFGDEHCFSGSLLSHSIRCVVARHRTGHIDPFSAHPQDLGGSHHFT